MEDKNDEIKFSEILKKYKDKEDYEIGEYDTYIKWTYLLIYSEKLFSEIILLLNSDQILFSLYIGRLDNGDTVDFDFRDFEVKGNDLNIDVIKLSIKTADKLIEKPTFLEYNKEKYFFIFLDRENLSLTNGWNEQPFVFLKYSTFENDVKIRKTGKAYLKRLKNEDVVEMIVPMIYKNGAEKLRKLKRSNKDKNEIGLVIQRKSSTKYQARNKDGFKLSPAKNTLLNISNFINSKEKDIEVLSARNYFDIYFNLKDICKFKIDSNNSKVRFGSSALPLKLHDSFIKQFREDLKEIGYKARKKYNTKEIEAWLLLLELNN